MKFFPTHTVADTSLFYKLTISDKRSYLFGSMHLATPEILTLSNEVYQALISAKIVVLEQFHVSDEEAELEGSKTLGSVINWLINNNQSPTEENTKKINFIRQKIKNWTTDAIPLALYHNLRDTAACATQSYRKLDVIEHLSFEDIITKKAEKFNIPCVGLESQSEALKAYWGIDLSLDEQLEIIIHFLPELQEDNIENYLPDMLKAYAAGNLEKLTKISLNKFANPQNIASVDKYRNLFITQRDLSMAKSIEKYLDQGNAFITVGASHLPGIINQLRQKGYMVQAISEGPRVHNLNDEAVPVNTL